MTTKAEKLQATLPLAQQNAWPAMVESLGEQLGVSPDALMALGIGWMPAVQFAKGTNWTGWWAIPERDSAGKLTSIALRAGTGSLKVMLPGGLKRGLTYAVDPTFSAETHHHSDVGFIRTMQAGVDCPICEKPDGCLVSDEDPEDPRAVICIRVAEGAVQPRQFGWLHHRKPHEFRKGSPLADSEHPVVVVEGMSDTAAAMTLGFVAVGRPSNLSGMAELRTLLRGRRVLVLGENDDLDKFGKRPGHEGMRATYENLRTVCPEVVQCLPPEDVKDLRGWVAKYAITAEDLLAHVAQAAEVVEQEAVLENELVSTLRDRWLQTQHWAEGVPTLRFQGGSWFRFNGHYYREVEEKGYVRGTVHAALEDLHFQKVSKEGAVELLPVNLTRGRVSDILDSALRICPVHEPAPVWVNGVIDVPNPADVIVFTNGILNIKTYLEDGDIDMLEPSPHLFTMNALPYDFEASREVSELWLRWLDETLGDDPAKILLLQEWFGYNLVADMSMEKMMVMKGPPRAGKGTAIEVLRALLGIDQVATTNLRSLGDAFGRAPLVGKLALFLSDARGGAGDTGIQSVETILNITGRDGINVNRKNLPELSHYYPTCRITMAVNELPTLYDPSQALASRLVCLEFARSFEDHANPNYKSQLIQEAPAIMLWALDGLRRLREQGHFTPTASGEALVAAFRRIISPIIEFLDECCVQEAGAETGMRATYDVWRGWTRDRGLKAWSRTKVKERIIASWPSVGYTKKTVANEPEVPVLKGLRLQRWAETMYLGRP